MNIPEKAVEAAARAQHAWDVRNGTFHSENYNNWDTLSASIRRDYLDAARLHVEAAAPFIAAQEAEIIADQMPGLTFTHRLWLMDRADELDPS